MNETGNYLYYTNKSEINSKIDNILSFRQFLNTILSNLRVGKYNKTMIEMISNTVKKFYSKVSDKNELYDADNSDFEDIDNNSESKLELISVSSSDTSDSDTEINRNGINFIDEINSDFLKEKTPEEKFIDDFLDDKLEFKYHFMNSEKSKMRLNYVSNFS
jgi:hypothetical protein